MRFILTRHRTSPRAGFTAVALCTLLLGVAASNASAASGDLDTAFSADGIVTTDFGSASDHGAGLALQSDGKIVTVGGNAAGDFALARYDTAGSLDTTFSGDGLQTTVFGGAAGFTPNGAKDVVLQPDGKLVAVGGDANLDFAIARYNPNGTLDTTFSGDGKQTSEFFGNDEANATVVQADGKIVVVGHSNDNFALARYNTDGSLDATFSGDGLQTSNFATIAFNIGAQDVALQPDGKLVVVGASDATPDGGDGFAVARYNTDGSLDTTFSGDGLQTTHIDPLASDVEAARTVALQADGKIVVGGDTGAADFALARYNTDGSLDSTFSGDGQQVTVAGDTISGLFLQPDGKIVAVGSANGFAVARYDASGVLDPTFSGDGFQTTTIGATSRATAGTLQADGKILAAGLSDGDFAVARYQGGNTITPPDADGDGVPDTLDACPTVAANTANGCPTPPLDSDGDGVIDSADACPAVAAPTSNGCPSPPADTDGDGVVDTADACPSVAATTASGCPTVPTKPPSDTTAPVAALTGSAQKLGKTVAVTIACTDEACNAKTSASVRVPAVGSTKGKTYKLTAIRTTIAKGKSVRVKLTLPTAARAAIKRALRVHKRIVVAVTLTVTDAAGNKRTLDRQIRLKA